MHNTQYTFISRAFLTNIKLINFARANINELSVEKWDASRAFIYKFFICHLYFNHHLGVRDLLIIEINKFLLLPLFKEY